MLEVEIKFDKKKLAKLKKDLLKLSTGIKKAIQQDWNLELISFVDMMQRKHMSAPPVKGKNPFKDQLRRVSSLLHNSIDFESKISGRDVQAAVFFLNEVKDYAPVHEYGSSKKNIPPRLSLNKEWTVFVPKLYKIAEGAVNKELK